MEINRELTEVLNDLIRINNDRMEGYHKAISESGEKDVDLRALFSRMVDDSRNYVSVLSHEVYKLGNEPATLNTTVSGKIYRAWMDIKSVFAGTDRLSLLEFCEKGEDAAQKAYEEALISNKTLSIDIRHIIARQKESLEASHEIIKKFRDMHRKADSDDIVNGNKLRNSTNDLRNEDTLHFVKN